MQIDLAPVDRGDHRPQHEREIARLARALEQAADQLGADERVLARRVERRSRTEPWMNSATSDMEVIV